MFQSFNQGRDIKETGKTRMIPKTLNPDWGISEKHVIKIPLKYWDTDSWETVSLRIDVWDDDDGRKGDFLGCVYLRGESLRRLLARYEPSTSSVLAQF